MSLTGKTAVVTGGGRGIGRGIATVLAARGASVAIWDLNSAGADETAGMIHDSGGTAIAIGGDVADAAHVAAAAAQTRAVLGPVTILVNNAGIALYDSFTTMTEESWDHMIRINLKGPFLVTRELVADMLEARWGRIVNISSSSAQIGAPSMAHYAASKGGIIGFSKALAIEYAAAGITVNNVPPGVIDTPLARESSMDIDAAGARMPIRRAGTPEDVAYAVAYLASEEAAYVTGQTLSVNGGLYLS